MKKTIRLLFLAIVSVAFSMTAKSQTVVFSEDFEAGIPADFTLIDADGLTPDANVSFFTDAWLALQEATTNVAAGSTSWYSPAGTANDWMWTPSIALTNNNVLSWNARCYNANFPDGYEVYVAATSTSNPALATKIFNITAESSAWTSHSINLSALGLTNQSVRIGFRNHTFDGLVLFVDDITVVKLNSFDAGFTSIDYPSEYSAVPFSQNQPTAVGATVINNGSSTLTNVRLKTTIYNIDSAITTLTSAPIASLAPGATQHFSQTDFLPAAPDFYIYENTVLMDQTDGNPANDTVYITHLVNDSIYARDDSSPIGALGLGGGNGGYLGQSYALSTPAKIAAVDIYYTAGYTGRAYAAAIFSIGPDGQPNQIVATTDTLYYPNDGDLFVRIPISGGDKALSAGNYVVAAIEFDSTINLAATAEIFTSGTTYLYFPGIPMDLWAHTEDFGIAASFVIRPVLTELCPAVSLLWQTTDALCFDENGTAEAFIGGIVPPASTYTFSWSDGQTGSFINAPAGVYSVTATDENGCTVVVDDVQINEPTAVGADVLVSDPPSAGANGFIETTPSGGVAPYTILWNDGSTSFKLVAPAGIYYFVITDAVGCQFISQDYEIHSVAQPMVGDIPVENGFCFGQAATLTANVSGGVTPYTYLWSTGATTASISTTTSGSYSVTVSDNVGTTLVLNRSLNLPSQITATSASTPASSQFAADGFATVNPTGGVPPYSFHWSSGSNNQTATGLLPAYYICTITDSNGCTITETVQVAFVIQPLVATTTVVPQGGCDGSPANLSVTVSGGVQPYSYNWSNGGTLASTVVFTGGTYTCTVTDAVSNTVVVTATYNQPTPIVGPTSSTPATCNNCPNGTATVTPSGGTPGYTYSWSNGATTQTATGLVPGQYSVVVTDANGCTFINGVTVTFMVNSTDLEGVIGLDVFPNPTADFVVVNLQLVENEAVTLKMTTADGKLIFEQKQPASQKVIQTIDLTDQPAGLYLLTIETAHGQLTRSVAKQ